MEYIFRVRVRKSSVINRGVLCRLLEKESFRLEDVDPPCRSEEYDEFYLVYSDEMNRPDGEKEGKGKLQRELDRLYLLTGERVEATLDRRVEEAGGISYKNLSLSLSYSIQVPLPDDVVAQDWTSDKNLNFSKQLRLYALADESNDPAFRALLLYMIIETEPDICCSSRGYSGGEPTEPQLEAKLLRDFTSHQQDRPDNVATACYAYWLVKEVRFYDPRNEDDRVKVEERINLVVKPYVRDLLISKVTRSSS